MRADCELSRFDKQMLRMYNNQFGLKEILVPITLSNERRYVDTQVAPDRWLYLFAAHIFLFQFLQSYGFSYVVLAQNYVPCTENCEQERLRTRFIYVKKSSTRVRVWPNSDPIYNE